MTLDYKILAQLYYGPELEYVPEVPGTPGTPAVPPTGYYTTMVPFLDKKFVGIGGNDLNEIFTSSDGINFTSRTPNASVNFSFGKPIEFKNKIFTLGTNNTKTSYSEDGITWSLGSYATAFTGLVNRNSVATNSDRIVAINTYEAYVSIDGINWNTYSLPINRDWIGMAYGNGVFVAVHNNSGGQNDYIYSTDGINWTIAYNNNLVNYGTPLSIHFLNNIFIITTDYMMNSIHYSYQGTDNWSTTGISVGNSKHIAYGNGIMVAAPDSHSQWSPGTIYLSTSSDGVNWNGGNATGYVNSYNNPISLTFGDGKFVLITRYGMAGMGEPDQVFTSTDGINWTLQDTGFDLPTIMGYVELDRLVEVTTEIGGQDGTPGTPGTPGYFNEIISPQVLYTVPAGKQTTVTAIYTANNDVVQRTYDLAVVPSGETLSIKHHVKWDAVAVENDFNLTDIKITLSSGDSLYVFPSTINKVGFTAFGIEIS